MSIAQFFRILRAYRNLVLLSTLVFLVGSVLFVQLVRPRYEAASRVMLDVIKPDPVTGQVMATAFLRAYTKTQIELVKDTQIARVVVDKLNWAKDPAMLKEYRESGQRDLDFPSWASQKVANNADAQLIEGSNILEIRWGSSSPEQAKRVADALRAAYMESTLQSRREAARRNAEWYEDQANKAKGVLVRTEGTKAKLERESGVILGDDKVDIDSARLAALAAAAGAPVFAPAAPTTTPSSQALATLDSELMTASQMLGPNHPQLQQMRRRRELLTEQVAQERRAASSAASSAFAASAATSGLLEAQKAKVMAQREKVEALRLLQDEIDLRRDQYNKAVARAAQLRQEAEVAESGVIPLGNAITPQSPEFPKKGLIVGVAIPAGAGLGLFIGLLMEIFSRRVRSTDDLASAVDAPVLAVIRNPAAKKRPWWQTLLPRAGAMRAPIRTARA